MYARIVVIAFAGFVGLAACNDKQELLAPSAAPSNILIAPNPTPRACSPELIICPKPWVDVSAGSGVTCAVLWTGSTSCWGDSRNGMLGRGSQSGSNATPSTVAGGLSFASVSVGVDHVCALQLGTRFAFCWGNNANGQLGLTGPSATSAPSNPASSSIAFSVISAGSTETCGVTTGQQLFCWGGSFGASPALQQPGALFSTVTESPNGYCALRTDGQLVNSSGSGCVTGAGPAQFLGQATTATHTCAISAGITQCWGSNSFGELGNRNQLLNTTSSSPVNVQAPAGVVFSSVTAGARHSCALAGTTAFCWGDNWYGELGIDGNARYSTIPQQVFGATAFTKITTGANHTCAIDTGGSVWCWGGNEQGQVGNGTITPLPSIDIQQPLLNGVASPVKVATPLVL